MREFTKSMMSYTWAMSLFGVQQMVNILTPQGQQQHPATKAFNEVAHATKEQMGDILKSTYRAGDNVQRGMVDVMFGLMTLGMFDRGGSAPAAANIGQQTTEAMRQGWRAVGQAADAVTQGAYAAAAGAQQAASEAASDAGWGPAPDGSTRASGRSQNGGGASGQTNAAGATGSAQQSQGWGPMPS